MKHLINLIVAGAISLISTSLLADKSNVSVIVKPNKIPVLKNLEHNPVYRLEIKSERKTRLKSIELSFEGSSNMGDIKSVGVYNSGKDSVFKSKNLIVSVSDIEKELKINADYKFEQQKIYLWISVQLYDHADLLNQLKIKVENMSFSHFDVNIKDNKNATFFRYGIALRKFGQDGIHTSRIPGLATSKEGILLAIYDARRNSGRDLQGDIDIGLNRSIDNGNTWEPIQVIMDMGEWGNLPEKFNGVSDACILVNGKDIYVAGLWMHGVINKEGKWLENLTEESDAWNHQWRDKGSQPGFGEKETSQFLMVKSTDDGHTWSDPINLTKTCKRLEWWLWAPAPGRGIVMENGTLVFPTQGRDSNGLPFSNITYSRDNGKTWQTSIPASHNTTECSVAEYEKGKLLLNIRDNRNRMNKSGSNGRAVFSTSNLGETWEEHETSHRTFIEPVCMASLYKHVYIRNGEQKEVLLFSNPHSKYQRINQTIKMSFDNGMTWPEDKWILLDEGKGRGYSCLTSIDGKTIGILYEGSRTDLVFQKIDLSKHLY